MSVSETIKTTKASLERGYTVEKVSRFQKQQYLLSQVTETIAGSYSAFSVNKGHLSKELKLCTDVYLAKNGQGEIVAFFMVGVQHIAERLFYYLGLSTCKPAYKSKGIGSVLYQRFAADCKKVEQVNGFRIPCYWTTATPIAYHWFCKHFKGVQPDVKGLCTDEAKGLLTKIAKSHYPAATFEPSTPFVLRGAASNFRFSQDERMRIEKAKTKLSTTIFDEYEIDESKGDRFLMIGFAP